MAATFHIEQKPFLAILASCLPICTKRTAQDGTSMLFLAIRHRELIIKCTDLEVALQIGHQLEDIHVDDIAGLLISCRRLHDVVKELEGTLELTMQEATLTLRSPAGSITLHASDAAHFPPFPEKIENLMEVSADKFVELLKAVSFVIPQQHANSALTGVLCEVGPDGMRMTATDGHCLAHVSRTDTTLQDSRSWLIPRRAILELQKIIEGMRERTVFIGTCGKQMVVSGESFNFFTKLLSGTFPSYTQVLERHEFHPARVSRGVMMRTVRRAAAMLSGQFIAAQFAFTPGRMTVGLTNKDVGVFHEEVSLEGLESLNSCEARFYAPYLLHGLTTFEDDTLALHIHSGMRPIMFSAQRESGMSQLYLVMPVAAQGASS